MNTLHLYKDKEIQGNFEQKKLNLLLSFQVNCPGCFLYALPLFNQLYKKYSEDLGFLALSTAFENFDLNTSENTIDLVHHGTLVGHTKHTLAEHGFDTLPIDPLFPIAMDQKMQDHQKEEIVSQICLLNPNYTSWSAYDQELFQSRVSAYVDAQPEVSMTFTANQFRGTPTIVLFNDKNEVLQSWFGHTLRFTIEEEIEKFL